MTRINEGRCIAVTVRTSTCLTITGDEVLATATLDRLLHHYDVLSINGPSYRLKDRFLKLSANCA